MDKLANRFNVFEAWEKCHWEWRGRGPCHLLLESFFQRPWVCSPPASKAQRSRSHWLSRPKCVAFSPLGPPTIAQKASLLWSYTPTHLQLSVCLPVFLLDTQPIRALSRRRKPLQTDSTERGDKTHGKQEVMKVFSDLKSSQCGL